MSAIHQNMVLYMQSLQQAAARGYCYYVTGDVDPAKFDSLQSKFDFHYSIKMSRQARHRRRSRGESVSVLHAVRFDNQIYYCLMATPGSGRVHEREKLSNLRDKHSRLNAPGQRYQLVNDGQSWTWAMTREHFYKYRERIHLCAALPPHRRQVIEVGGEQRDKICEKLLDSLYVEPGFRIVRRQVGELVKYLNSEWKRLRPDGGIQPAQRTFLGYVRFQKSADTNKILQPRQKIGTPEERQQKFWELLIFRKKRNAFRRALKAKQEQNTS